MNQTKLIGLLVVVGAIVIGAMSVAYTVDERERALVIRFGKVIRTADTPGLRFKVPFIDNVRFFDSRILTLDAEPQRFLTQEKKNVIVDWFVKWRVGNTLKYWVALGGQESEARRRLEQRVRSDLLAEFGKRTVRDTISGDRNQIMDVVSKRAGEEAGALGIEVVDIRIKRVDLPPDVSESVYQRMVAERARIAKEFRARGAEEAEKIRADAERQREILLAEAYGTAERVRGEGDGRATSIYAKAYNRYPEFYSFYRSLVAYRASFNSKDDVLIIDPSAEFFKYMKNPRQ
ncbi:MAG: protease modulator HflC [Gammaproteobacteria bacterium]|nr:MAG: protease modulator HflC [Gammaproteobacteria bacterium]